MERTEESAGVEIGEDRGKTELLLQTQGVAASRTTRGRAADLESFRS